MTADERKLERKAKREKGICDWPGCEVKTDKRLMGARYAYCADHRKYFKEWQEKNK